MDNKDCGRTENRLKERERDRMVSAYWTKMRAGHPTAQADAACSMLLRDHADRHIQLHRAIKAEQGERRSCTHGRRPLRTWQM